MSKISKRLDLKSSESNRSLSNDPEASKLCERLKYIQSTIDEKQKEINTWNETILKQSKCRSVSPGNKLINYHNKSKSKL